MGNQAQAQVRVLMVEDDAPTRERFRQALAQAPDLQLVASFDNGREALRWLEFNQPDVVLTDLGLPDLPGLAVITYCAMRHPQADIMVITMYEDETHVLRSLEAGASGYLLKDSLDDEIVDRVRELAAGGAPMTPLVARLVLNRLRPQHLRRPAPGSAAAPAAGAQPLPDFRQLTDRELLVLGRIAQGFTYAEIAALEQVSRHTVHAHIKNIYSKLAVHSRTEAVFEAGRLGLIDSQMRS